MLEKNPYPLKKDRKCLKAALVLLLFLAAAAAAWAWSREPEPPAPAEVLQQEAKPLAPETEIDTSDWLTYRNPKFGYEISYPQNWRIIEMREDKERGIEPYQWVKVTPGSTNDYYYAPVGIISYENSKNLSFEQWYSSKYSNNRGVLEKIKTIKNGDAPIFKIERPGELFEYYVTTKNEVFSLAALDGQEDFDVQNSMMDKIVGTFRP